MAKSSRKGASVIESIIGATIVAGLVYAGTSILRPLEIANKRARIQRSMIKIENEIRNGVFTQSDYSNLNNFSIQFGSVLLARQDRVIYVSDDLNSSSEDQPLDIQVRMKAQSFSGGARLGVIYQISSKNKDARFLPLGVQNWPVTAAEQSQFLENQFSGTSSVDSSSTALVIPSKLANAQVESCANGFVRGFDSAGRLKCWEFTSNLDCGTWAVPVGYSFDGSTNRISILCRELNRMTCPKLQITLKDQGNRVVTMDNFYVLSHIDYSDFLKSNGRVPATQCESVLDIYKYGGTDAIIHASKVNSMALGGADKLCPDDNLYKKDMSGNCVPNFNHLSLKSTVPATLNYASPTLRTK